MRRLFPVVVVGFLLCLTDNAAAVSPCPRTNVQQIQWVELRVNTLVRAARAAYADDAAEPQYDRVVFSLSRAIKRCKLVDDPVFAERFPEFLEYVKLLSLATDDEHELGFEVTDRTYFAETVAYTTIPDFLLSPAFLKAASRFETLPEAKAQLRAINQSRTPRDQLLFFSYDSRHLGTPDNSDSFRRLLILVPGNEEKRLPEKWVQFGIADPRRPASVRNISVVAVMPGANDTTQVYFKDFYRTFERNGTITVKGRWELGEGDDNCVSCHKSGVLPIFPEKGSVSEEELPLVDVINARFDSYGPARFDKYLDTTKFGPSFGSARPGASVSRRLGKETCSTCHHANDMGPLNWPMNSTIVSSFVEGGKMPLGATLTRTERVRLYQRLVNDYFAIDNARPGILKAWLLGKSREAESTDH